MSNGDSHLHKETEYPCIVEAHESTRKRLESTLPRNHEDHIAEKGLSSLSHHNLLHTFIPLLQAMKIPDAKAAVDEEWEKLETIPAWSLDKAKSKKEVILEARRDKQIVHFATLMDICHLKNAELEPMHQQYKGRVVLLGDTVKDDSGAYAVFTEQGSSASQMTAAKVMDVIARCAGQAVDAVLACTQVKNGGRSKVVEGMSIYIWVRLNLYSHPLSGLKDNLRKFYRDLDGKKYRTGNVFLCTGNKDCSYRYTWMTLK